MRQGITNVYITTTAQFSALVIESLKHLNYSINKINENYYEIILDSYLIMSPDTIYVFDGLVNSIKVAENQGRSIISVWLEYPCTYQLKEDRSLPERLIVLFNRTILKNLLKHKVIVIDPGHGGKDLGHRGYINLLEKNVVMDVAEYLKRDLLLYGAHSVKTREKDISLSMKDRINTAILLEADMFISIHTNWDRCNAIGGAKGIYWGRRGKKLCESILREIEKRPRLKNLGVNQGINLFQILGHPYVNDIPFVKIEICTISNPVEEGWLRSPVFKKRLADAIRNGIANFLFQNNNIDV